MSEATNDRDNLENLLNALSISEAINVFYEIDKKIIQLLECSSEDFLSLNDHFKTYYKDSKKISQNANEIILLITNTSSHNNFESLKHYNEIFLRLHTLISTHAVNIENKLHKALNKYESLFVAHNNYKQNLTSLKLLVANLSVNDPLGIQQSKVDEKIEKIKSILGRADHIFEQFKTLAIENQSLLSDVKRNNTRYQQALGDKIEASIQLYSKKYNEASELIPGIKEQSEKCSSSIASIITNLQYHDIITQKIQHIQRTHKDILNELNSYKTEEKSFTLLHNKAKTFLKIRDIAGLQAAQLLHANKQYQMAIIEIAKNLEYIGNEMISITQECEKFIGFSEQSRDGFLNNIIENLNKALEFSNSLSNNIIALKLKIDSLNAPIEEFEQVYFELFAEKEVINDVIENLNRKCNLDSSETDTQTLAQINELAREINHSEQQIKTVYNDIKSILSGIVNEDNFLVEKKLFTEIQESSVSVAPLLDLLNKNNVLIEELLNYNTSVSQNVLADIKKSVKRIKYYDLFEKVSEEIIEELNNLNVKLNYGSDPESAVRRGENLKQLKERYTMASEHIIHDRMTNISHVATLDNNAEKDIIDLTDEKNKQDDDNLELF